MEIILTLLVASLLAVAVNGLAIWIGRATESNDDDKADKQ